MRRGWRWRAASPRRRNLRRPRATPVGAHLASASPALTQVTHSPIPFSFCLFCALSRHPDWNILHNERLKDPPTHPTHAPSPARRRSKRVKRRGGGEERKIRRRADDTTKTNRARLLFCFCAGLTPLRLLVIPRPPARRPLQRAPPPCTIHRFWGFLFLSCYGPPS